ncbi:PLP-dependent aminotransferase family protein [Vannielia litorea]|uniref:MocR-like pyridoxine biosynthesis transcription factor PdxR n=1 Tax=Vannielia litorea TaxID=1217970 RepID=UPI001C947BED|nr:PLP-dependent aminotransferase family protein [Vannielia litorea]MBY6154891.1 PLP-dependent aminotransferase family protein [Vannielia litorea]
MTKYAGGALIPGLSVDRSDAASLSMQLATRLRDMILSGELPPGTRLPATRVLARDHGVSRTTAVTVYEQLASEGMVTSHVGAGTYVSQEVRPHTPATPRPQSLPRVAGGHSAQFFPRLEHPRSPLPFVTGMPAFDAFPMAQWARMQAKYWRSPRSNIMSYPEAAGLPALREAICRHLRANRGLTCAPEEVFVFAGAQDAFLQIAQILLEPGDPVWIENPGAIGARNAFLARGARLVPVPVDAQGLDVSVGRAAEPRFRAAFTTPAHQHPLGMPMSRDRRFELLEEAERAEAWVIEDDYVGEFHYGRAPLPPLKALDAGGRVIYVGTFSKALFPAIRLGYAVVPPGLTEVFTRTLEAAAHGVSHSVQAVVASFIEEGRFSAHIRRMRDLYRDRRDALMEAAETNLKGLLKVQPTETGFHTVGFFPEPRCEKTFAKAALAEGLATSPLSRFALAAIAQEGLTLGFSAVPRIEIERGVERLARALRAAPR